MKSGVLEKNGLLEKLHQVKGIPRVEIGCFPHSTLANYLNIFSQNGDVAAYIIKDMIVEDHSFEEIKAYDDFDIELLTFESSVLEELADEALNSENHEATTVCDATYLRHKEWCDYYKGHTGDSTDDPVSGHTGEPMKRSPISVTLTLKIENEKPALSVDYNK